MAGWEACHRAWRGGTEAGAPVGRGFRERAGERVGSLATACERKSGTGWSEPPRCGSTTGWLAGWLHDAAHRVCMDLRFLDDIHIGLGWVWLNVEGR